MPFNPTISHNDRKHSVLQKLKTKDSVITAIRKPKLGGHCPRTVIDIPGLVLYYSRSGVLKCHSRLIPNDTGVAFYSDLLQIPKEVVVKPKLVNIRGGRTLEKNIIVDFKIESDPNDMIDAMRYSIAYSKTLQEGMTYKTMQEARSQHSPEGESGFTIDPKGIVGVLEGYMRSHPGMDKFIIFDYAKAEAKAADDLIRGSVSERMSSLREILSPVAEQNIGVIIANDEQLKGLTVVVLLKGEHKAKTYITKVDLISGKEVLVEIPNTFVNVNTLLAKQSAGSITIYWKGEMQDFLETARNSLRKQIDLLRSTDEPS